MTHDGLRVSAIALGMAVLASFSARADMAGTTPSPSAAAPSLSEPAPTPGWAESGPAPASEAAAVQPPTRPSARHYARHSVRHYGWRNAHRYAYSSNPMASAATGVVGGVADVGSLAAYPLYCFPNYGSCPVYWPHRF